APVAGRAGLSCRRPVDIQHALGAEGPHACVAIGENVGDEICRLRRENLWLSGRRTKDERPKSSFIASWRCASVLGLCSLVTQGAALSVSNAYNTIGNYPPPAVRERAIRGGQLKRRDVAAAERQREAVAPGVAQRGDAKAPGHLQQRRDADAVQHAYRRDVRGCRQRLAQGQRAMKGAVVVLRRVRAALAA